MATSKVLVWSLRYVFVFSLALLSANTFSGNSNLKSDTDFKSNPNSELLAKSRYSAGLVCQDKGWEFCARWAQSRRSPRSRIA